MLWLVLFPCLIAAGVPWLVRRLGTFGVWLVVAVPAVLTVLFARELPARFAEPRVESFSWVPDLGVSLAMRLDGLSLTFALLITGIGTLVLAYAAAYLKVKKVKGDASRATVLALLLLFLGAMLGLVLADDVITLFVFWEATSVVSYLLIGTKHSKEESRKAAVNALLITGGGGLALFVGLLMMVIAGQSAGLSLESATRLSQLLTVDLTGHPLTSAIVVLLALGAFTKSAQMPFHVWLPQAMVAPTPVSAYLHSATMVKAGVYLFARVHPMFGELDLWRWLLTPVGAVTMVIAAVMAVAQRDLKRVLAYSTVSVLGTLVMLLGVGTVKAITAAVVFLVAHALYKAALFMVAGSIDHSTGTRDLDRLGGLAVVMPWTLAGGLLAALSKAGAPPMFGFVGKELLYAAKLNLDNVASLLVVAAVLANILLVATALLVGLRPFIGRRGETPRSAHEAPVGMVVGPLLLGAVGLFIGVFPSYFDSALGSATASAILGEPVIMRLKLWHGVSFEALAVLTLSAVTVAAGIGTAIALRRPLANVVALVRWLGRIGPARVVNGMLPALYSGAGAVARRLTGPVLRNQIAVAVAMVTGVLCTALYAVPHLDLHGGWRIPVLVHELIVAGLIVVAAVAVAVVRSRLAAVAALGAVGLGMATLFALYSAPDLAITQVMVEALSVIMLVLVFVQLPRDAVRERAGMARWRDAALAAAAGGAIFLAVVVVAEVGGDSSLAEYFVTRAVPEAYGRNVVNVILVDFRALDTLGEIAVVAAAGLGVLAILRQWGGGRT